MENKWRAQQNNKLLHVIFMPAFLLPHISNIHILLIFTYIFLQMESTQ